MGRPNLRPAIAERIHTIAAHLEAASNALAEVAADALETPGNAVRAACDLISVGWLGDVVASFSDLAAAAVKAVLGAAGGSAAGAVRMAGGAIMRDTRLLTQGAADVGASVTGGVLSVGAAAVSGVQVLTLFERSSRRLTADELSVLRGIFGRSISFFNVRVVDGRAGVFDVNNRPFTRNNRIYLKGGGMQTLVHECVHVWQYQHHGTRYMGDALGAQVFVEDAYNWEREFTRGKTKWNEFNAEAQAAFIDALYAYGEPTDHAEPAREALAVIRSARNFRLSSRL
ncbi:MAG TPA: hypothetical protein VMZ22_02830 [Acidimicrobiales bacterium]|nr:hypothetical protein [Acidimicrobiales bacterium]